MAALAGSAPAQAPSVSSPPVVASGTATEDAHRLYSVPLTFTKPDEVLKVLQEAVTPSLEPYFVSGQVPGVDFIVPVEHNHSFIIRATVDGKNEFRQMVRCVDVPAGSLGPVMDTGLMNAAENKRLQVEDRFYASIGGLRDDEGSATVADSGDVPGVYELRLLNATPQFVLDTLMGTLSSGLRPQPLSDTLAVEKITSIVPDAKTKTLIVNATGNGCADFKSLVSRLGVKATEEVVSAQKIEVSPMPLPTSTTPLSQSAGSASAPAQQEAMDSPHHLYRISLTYAKPHEVLDDLRNMLTSTLGPYFMDKHFGEIDFIIPIERSRTLIVRTSVDGFNHIKDVVSNIDVPTPADIGRFKSSYVVKLVIDPTVLNMLKKRQASLRFYDDTGGIPRYGGTGPYTGAGVRVYHLHLLNATPQYVLDTLKQSVSSSLRPVTWYNILPSEDIAYILPETRTNTLIVRATPVGYADFKNIVERLGVRVTDDAPATSSDLKSPVLPSSETSYPVKDAAP